MAFQTKTDYCGLATVSANFTVKDSAVNGSQQKYQPKGDDGSFIATEVYGADEAPTNNYGLSADVSLAAAAITLGTILTQDSKKYALESVDISTAAASAPTISATCRLVESTATTATMSKYELPALALSTKQKAQNLFSAFTLSGTGCVLTACSLSASCSVNTEKVAGTIIASDVNSGVLTVSGTILQTGDTAPTFAAASGWTVTKAPLLTESNPETAYKTYSFEVQKMLAKATPTQVG